jgi:hypothetical protein
MCRSTTAIVFRKTIVVDLNAVGKLAGISAWKTPRATFHLMIGSSEYSHTMSCLTTGGVSSVDTAMKDLEQLGVAVILPSKDSPWGRRAAAADLDGHRVELTE